MGKFNTKFTDSKKVKGIDGTTPPGQETGRSPAPGLDKLWPEIEQSDFLHIRLGAPSYFLAKLIAALPKIYVNGRQATLSAHDLYYEILSGNFIEGYAPQGKIEMWYGEHFELYAFGELVAHAAFGMVAICLSSNILIETRKIRALVPLNARPREGNNGTLRSKGSRNAARSVQNRTA